MSKESRKEKSIEFLVKENTALRFELKHLKKRVREFVESRGDLIELEMRFESTLEAFKRDVKGLYADFDWFNDKKIDNDLLKQIYDEDDLYCLLDEGEHDEK